MQNLNLVPAFILISLKILQNYGSFEKNKKVKFCITTYNAVYLPMFIMDNSLNAWYWRNTF